MSNGKSTVLTQGSVELLPDGFVGAKSMCRGKRQSSVPAPAMCAMTGWI